MSSPGPLRLESGHIYITRSGHRVTALATPANAHDWVDCSDGRRRLRNGIYATRYRSMDLVREWQEGEPLPRKAKHIGRRRQ